MPFRAREFEQQHIHVILGLFSPVYIHIYFWCTEGNGENTMEYIIISLKLFSLFKYYISESNYHASSTKWMSKQDDF